MADFKNEFNNENNGQSSVHPSKNMHETASRKKQAFVELKNVIHIQSQPKPLKYDNLPCSQRKKKRNSVIQPQHNDVQEVQIKEPETELEKEELELLNYFDFDRSCCAAPYKGDRQIWAENMFDDSLINKIIQSGIHDKEDEYYEPVTVEDSLDDSDCEDLLNMNSSMLFTVSANSASDYDMLPPPPPLPILLDTSDLPEFDDFCLGV